MSPKPAVKRILAFDPGYERLGAAILERQGSKEVLLHSQCVRTAATLPFERRLHDIGRAAEGFIKQWQPDAMALEQVFFEKNAKTAMQIAEVRGALAYIASQAGLPVLHYAPSAIKVAITGYGRSDKAAVAAMVLRLVSLPARKRLDDEIDAIAVGITCLASTR